MGSCHGLSRLFHGLFIQRLVHIVAIFSAENVSVFFIFNYISVFLSPCIKAGMKISSDFCCLNYPDVSQDGTVPAAAGKDIVQGRPDVFGGYSKITFK